MKYEHDISFSDFCRSMGAPVKNIRNDSWCAVNSEKKFALFTIWDDEIISDGPSYRFWDGPDDVAQNRVAGRTMKKVLDTVISDGFAAYGILCEARWSKDGKKQRGSFDQHNLLPLIITREEASGSIKGRFVGHAGAQFVSSGASFPSALEAKQSAVDDIVPDVDGNDDAEYRERMAGSYVRDARVRKAVLRRAAGRCEYRGCASFKKKGSDEPYLETHHIIMLSQQGRDRPSNVIALCPNHHREAHFGENWKSLQDEFLTILKKLVS